MNVAVLGASPKPTRYSYQAVAALQQNGHRVYPVHPVYTDVLGLPVYPLLSCIPEALDVITVYVSAARSHKLAHEILESGARCVFFNPGAENEYLAETLRARGTRVMEVCTLVLLATGQFERVCAGQEVL